MTSEHLNRLIASQLPDKRVQVSYRRAGEEEAQFVGDAMDFEFPLSDRDLEDLRWYLEDYLIAPYAVYEERGRGIEGKLAGWGEALFNLLFKQGLPARDAYLTARETDTELIITSEYPEFLALPWELIKDPERDSPLALSLCGIRRGCKTSSPLTSVPSGEVLRVLMVISRPSGLDDIDYQMVARPLHDRLQLVRGKVQFDVLRPPTLDALKAQLLEAKLKGDPYHVLHFDGHGVQRNGGAGAMFDAAAEPNAETGFLAFEKENGGIELVAAGDFALLVKEGAVPLVVLNACQSAAMGTSAGASVATRLLEEGARSVIAMSHSVYAVAAADFMAQFYEELFKGQSMLEAVTAGRKQLRRSINRPSSKGPLPLQDWCVPVLYARSAMSFPSLATTEAKASTQEAFGKILEKVKTQDKKANKNQDAIDGDIAAEADIFVGRGSEFYKLELAAQYQKVMIIHGPAGTGKTELAKGFARWWRDTGGLFRQDLVFFHSFEPGLASFGLQGVLSELAIRLLPSDQLAQLNPDQLRSFMVRALRDHAMLLIWDNFESVYSMPDKDGATAPLDEEGRREIDAFLAEIAKPGGKSVVLITSRTKEDWLDASFRRIELGSLTPQEAAEYGELLLAPYAEARRRPSQDPKGYEDLLAQLEGHPLSMKLILPHLENHSPRTLLAGLKGQGSLPPGFEGEGRTKGLGASMLYSLSHLEADDRHRLQILSLFEGVVDADILGVLSAQEGAPSQFAGQSTDNWVKLLDQATSLGLLTSLGAGLYRLHPALPAFLAAQWRANAKDTFEAEHKAVRTALITAHAALGGWLRQQIEGGNAGLAFKLLSLQRRTLGIMIRQALSQDLFDPAQDMLQPLIEYLKACGLTSEIGEWTTRSVDATETTDGTAPAFDTDAGALWLFATGVNANQAQASGNLKKAEKIYNAIRLVLESSTKSDRRDRHLASIYHQLGMVAQDRGDLDAAETWYKKSLEIREALGNRPGMASSYHQLGRVAQDRGNLDTAETWYKKSLEIREALGNRPGMASSYHQLGIVAQHGGDLDAAETWYKKALDINETLGNRPGMASSYGQLGLLAEKRGDPHAAFCWIIRCISLFDQFGHPSTGPASHHLARLMQTHGQDALAKAWLEITGKQIPKELLEILERLSKEQEDD
ncbi:tetratricopeptide repeat protein [uncultured Cohaesibacter sp.]|uniref:tetratricopeptide repeat protein n=1 Tax=uncultured Cohaesibacter sp. TaxID=1002546 RepID=UPI002AA68C99|nr:tetratricopeptide repeat protein [uncultured Cohaesibacter sp.]